MGPVPARFLALAGLLSGAARLRQPPARRSGRTSRPPHGGRRPAAAPLRTTAAPLLPGTTSFSYSTPSLIPLMLPAVPATPSEPPPPPGQGGRPPPAAAPLRLRRPRPCFAGHDDGLQQLLNDTLPRILHERRFKSALYEEELKGAKRGYWEAALELKGAKRAAAPSSSR